MRPPTINAGRHGHLHQPGRAARARRRATRRGTSITSCRAPCNKGSGIGYPLAGGPIDFDSGQLGYGTGTSTEVTTGSNVYTTPRADNKPG